MIFAIPDTVDLIGGRISDKQMLKNRAASAGGIGGAVAGMALGASIGSVFPGPGNIIGGAIGSIAGGVGGNIGIKALTDLIAEDDAVEMKRIVSVELQNLTEEYLLNQEEAEEVVGLLEKQMDAKKLKDMYASGDRHQYAREMIQPMIDKVVARRASIELPSDEEIQTELIKTLEEFYDEMDPNLQIVSE